MGGLKKAAINSIYTFASIQSAMVIIAPPSRHRHTGQVANHHTVRRRLWCRVEHLSFCCSQGTDMMYVHKGEHLESLPADWMESVCCVMDSDCTCCRLHHSTSPSCDRETAVSSLLAMYCDVYSRIWESQGGETPDTVTKYAWNLITKHRQAMFPKHFQYVTAEGEVTRELFGDLIAGRACRRLWTDVDDAFEFVRVDTL